MRIDQPSKPDEASVRVLYDTAKHTIAELESELAESRKANTVLRRQINATTAALCRVEDERDVYRARLEAVHGIVTQEGAV